MKRRFFLLAAPAIVAAPSLMKIAKPFTRPEVVLVTTSPGPWNYADGTLFHMYSGHESNASVVHYSVEEYRRISENMIQLLAARET